MMIVTSDLFGSLFYTFVHASHKTLLQVQEDNPVLPALPCSDRPELVLFAGMISSAHVCVAAEQFASEMGVPFIPVLAGDTKAIVGPIWAPWGGTCWECFVKRREQGSATIEPVTGCISTELDLRLFAFVTAERVLSLWSHSKGDAQLKGMLWEFDSGSTSIREREVIGVHNCERCGLKRDVRLLSTSAILEDCTYLWRRDDATLHNPVRR